MGLLNGKAGAIVYSIEGELPESNNIGLWLAEQVLQYSFVDIDETFDEYSVGWVSILDMFDSKFKYFENIVGDYLVLSLRIDIRKIPGAILNKFVEKEERRIREEKQVPKLSRSHKAEIKGRVRAELMKKAEPAPAVYDLFWNLSDSTVMFFNSNKKAQEVLEVLFFETFGVRLLQKVPFHVAEQFLTTEEFEKLDVIREKSMA